MCKKGVGTGGIITEKVALCSWQCFQDYQVSPAAQKMRERMERKDLTDRRERLKSIQDHIRAAQREFNHYIRVRDKHRKCISCSKMLTDTVATKGFDCGHYLSRSVSGKGSSKWRFHPKVAAGQCKKCNRWASGNFVAMRIGMIERFGIESIEKMEADNTERKFTLSELERIRKVFQKRRRIYERKFRSD